MEKRVYEITGLSEHLDELERLFKCMGVCGEIGTTQDLHIFFDGDGRARLIFKRSDTGQMLDDPDCKVEDELYDDPDALEFSFE